jgi:glycosyltransferase involved in cell wall biosynthesis
MSPRVTIGLPVYNGERYLAETLDSLLGQTFADFELVVADNASVDATRSLCESYAARDARIRYHRNDTNVGAAGNFNVVLGLAQAPYFKLANADDLCAPDYVERCVTVLDERPDVVLCYARTSLIDENGSALGPYDDGLSLLGQNPVRRFRTVLERIGLVNVLQGVARTEVVRKAGGIGSFVGADEVLVAAMALEGEFFEIPERLFSRRMHPGAFSALTDDDCRQAFEDPSSAGRLAMRASRHYMELSRVVMRSTLAPSDKRRLAAITARVALSDRRRLVREWYDAIVRRRRRMADAEGA